MRLERTARRHQAGTDPTIWHDFAPGQPVMTVDGLPGRVVAVQDGRLAGDESYEVVLDNNMGGGQYRSSDLRALSPTVAAVEHDAVDHEAGDRHLASDDYPMLSEILVRRPPLERTASWDENGVWKDEEIVTERCAHCDCTENTHQLDGRRCVAHHDCPGWEPGRTTSWTPHMPQDPANFAKAASAVDSGSLAAREQAAQILERGNVEAARAAVEAHMAAHPEDDPVRWAENVVRHRDSIQWIASKNDSIVGETNVQYQIVDEQGGTHGTYGTQGTAERHKFELGDNPQTPDLHVKPLQVPMTMTAGWVLVDQHGAVWAGPFENKYRAEDDKAHYAAEAEASGITLMVNRINDGDGIGGEGWGGGGLEEPSSGSSLYATATETPVHLGGVLDTINDAVTDKMFEWSGFPEGGGPSHDWCAYRHNSHCFWPKDLNVAATKQAGYPVWIPFDRGPCPRVKWESQQACPMGDPGPHSGSPDARLESWRAWEDGGQRGGYAGSKKTALTPEDTGGHLFFDMQAIVNVLGQDQYRSVILPLVENCERYVDTSQSGKGIVVMNFPSGTAAESVRQIFVDAGAPKSAIKMTTNVHYSMRSEWKGNATCPHCAKHGWDGDMCFTCNYGDPLGKGYIVDRELWAENYERHFGSISVEASFEFTSTWRDIQAKASRIRKENGVRIISVSNGYVTAEVKGDNAVYQTTIMRAPGSNSVAMWECGCPWATYSWGRSGRWKKYEGRMCAHALALVYQAQSEEWGNGQLAEQAQERWPGEKVKVPDAYKRRPPAWRTGSLDGESMRRVDTDPSLYLPPRMAIRGFDVRIGNSIRKVVDIIGDHLVKLMDGTEIPCSKVQHPGFDPRKGLNFHESAKLAMPGVKMDFTPEEAAAFLFQRAETVGPKVTRDMQNVAKLVGGKMAGLDFKYKSEDSLARKLRDKYWDKANGNASRAADMVTDSLRFTILLSPMEFTHDVSQAIYAFQELGYKITSEENSWQSGDAYSGLHYGLEYQDIAIELQFHTAQSYDVKQNKTHKILEEFRKPSTPMKRKQELWDVMTKYYEDVQIPKDVLNFPFEKMYPRPASLQRDLDVIARLTDDPTWMPTHEASIQVLSQAEVRSGAMVALVPPLAVRQALIEDGGESLDQMHITLVYLGKASDVDRDAIQSAVAEWAAGTPQLPATFSGYGNFINGEAPVLWAGFDVPEVTRYREGLVDALGRRGVVPPNNHGFAVHMTLAYDRTGVPEDAPPLQPFAFDSVALVFADEWTHYPLNGGPVEPIIGETVPDIIVEGDPITVDAAIFEGVEESHVLDDAIAARLASDPESPLTPTAAVSHDEGASEVHFEVAGGGTPGPGGDPMRHLAGTPSEDSRSWLMDGATASEGSGDIAAAAREFLKTGAKKFTPIEQRQIIDEGRAEGTRAANLGSLDLEGTHYTPPSETVDVTDDELLWM